MNHRMVMYSLGSVLGVLAALLLLPAGVGLLYGEKSAWAYVITALIAGAQWLCLTLAGRTKNKVIYAKEGLAIVALVWVLISAVGALPFVISGEIPSYIDAFFETVSGFTTTGASVLSHPEAEPLLHAVAQLYPLGRGHGGIGVCNGGAAQCARPLHTYFKGGNAGAYGGKDTAQA